MGVGFRAGVVLVFFWHQLVIFMRAAEKMRN
jgi:hypothetical protein